MKHTKPVNVVTVVGGIGFVVFFLLGLIAFAGFFSTGNTYSVSAYVYNARGIAQYSTVFEAGLPVGIVTGVARSGPDAVVTMDIKRGVKPLPVDTRAQLGLRSLLGEADVLLTPGHATETVRNGGSLGLRQIESYTEVDQILNSFAGPTENRFRGFLQGLGGSVAGQGRNLNDTVGGFASLVNNSQPLTSILAYQRGQVADVVQYFGDVMGAIGQRTTALQQFARGALTTFNAVAGRDTALKAMMSDFPYAINSVAAVGTALIQTEPYLTQTVDHLSQVVRDLSPTVPLIAPGAANGERIISALGSAAPQLKSLLVNLRQLQPSASGALPAVHALTCQFNPMARYLQPYGPDISAFFQNFGAADNFYNSTSGGHELPAIADIDPNKVVRGVSSQPNDNGVQALVNLGVFGETKAQPTRFHETRPPGRRNDTTYGGAAKNPIDFGAMFKYPHVFADCRK